MALSAKTIFRDYVTDGVPSSGPNKPRKSEIREWGSRLETGVNGWSYETIAEAAADEIPATIGVVNILTGDRAGIYTDTNNGSTATFTSSGATSRVFYRDKSDILNVKWFGATGDGVSNDGPAIQAALDLAAIFKSAVFLPAGTYLTNQELKVPSYVWLFGAGMKLSTIKAAATLPRTSNVVTNKKNNGLARTDYDVGIHLSDFGVDGNDSVRTVTRVAGKGMNIGLSTVRDCVIERVYSTAASMHNFDVFASVYQSLGGSFVQPDGPSLHVSVVDCVSEYPGYDDCYTVHNSGYVKFVRCRAHGPAPFEWSYGFEFDEGSWGCVAEDCYASGGFVRGFASKGHPSTYGAQFNKFIGCTSDGNAQGMWIFHGTSGGGPNTWGVSVRDFVIKDPITNAAITGFEHLMEIEQARHVEVSNLTIINPAKGIIKINTGSNDVTFDGVHIYGVATIDAGWTDKLGIFTIYGGVVSRANISISNVKAYSAQPRPIIRLYDGDGTYRFFNIDADGSDNTLGIIHIPTALSTTLAIGGVIGSGWAGLVYDTAQSRAYNDFYRQDFGEMKFVSIASGSPEGVTYAPAGSICFAYRSGNGFKKNTAGNLNTGWTAF